MRKSDIILLGYIILARFTQSMLSYYDKILMKMNFYVIGFNILESNDNF